jgi:hypothetical protein
MRVFRVILQAHKRRNRFKCQLWFIGIFYGNEKNGNEKKGNEKKKMKRNIRINKYCIFNLRYKSIEVG